VRSAGACSLYGGASSRYGGASLPAFPRSQAAAASQSVCVMCLLFCICQEASNVGSWCGSQAAAASQVSCTLVCSGLSTMFCT
jgi:hypothetical protein